MIVHVWQICICGKVVSKCHHSRFVPQRDEIRGIVTLVSCIHEPTTLVLDCSEI